MKKFLIPVLFLFLYSCEGVKVTNNWDKKLDFKQFKTYSLFPWDTHNNQIVNDYDKQTILTSIKIEMEKRGYKFVKKDGDLVVSTFVIVENKTSYQAYTNHYGGWAGYGGGWGGGYGGGMSTTDVNYYDEATVIVDIADAEKKELAWRGTATGIVRKSQKEQSEAQADADEVINKILADFPPGKEE